MEILKTAVCHTGTRRFFLKSGRGEGQALALRQEERFFIRVGHGGLPVQVLALRYEEQLLGNEAIGSPKHSAIPFSVFETANSKRALPGKSESPDSDAFELGRSQTTANEKQWI